MTPIDDQRRLVARLDEIVQDLSRHLDMEREFGGDDFASKIAVLSTEGELSRAQAELELARFALELLESNDDMRVALVDEKDRHGPVSVLAVGRFLSHLQVLANAVQQAREGLVTAKGRVQRVVSLESTLLAAGGFSGSFGVRIVAAKQDQAVMGGSDDSGSLMFQIVDLLDSSQFDRDHVLALCKQSSRVFSAYRDILSHISKSRITVKSVSKGKKFGVVLSSLDAGRREEDLLALEESTTIYDVVGRLVGASIVRDNFELELADSTIIHGRVKSGLSKVIVEQNLYGKRVLVTIAETVESQPDGLAEPRSHYELIAVEGPERRLPTLFDR